MTELRVWLPDPANPANATLEGRLFHPELLARIADFDAAFLRFMDWGSTNASPQRDWAFETAQARAGTADAWSLTTEVFGSCPVGVAANAHYWTRAALARHVDETFRERKRRIFSGWAAEGGGPDSTGMGGGFDSDLRVWVRNAFGRNVPIVSREDGRRCTRTTGTALTCATTG